ncbi:hypothetical protein BKA70DRAFT_1556920 [Coprinopsis sp. MPI-PUGE-AT-0042]|nr:hypothetical protein BKA70DRAFT_1556920 [Coprinopsis sp. MPI-PUGE-AT-0042]
MSLLKKVARRLGGNGRMDRANGGHAAAESIQDVPSSFRQQGYADPDPGSSERPDTPGTTFAQSQYPIAHQEHNVSIAGGTFMNAGRDVTTNIHNHYVDDGVSESNLFATLNPIAAAHDCQAVSSKTTECFEGTRRHLLLEIERWRTTISVPVFILDGIAGIGKTTVLKTVCTRAAADKRLAASWFFSRDEQDRKTTRGFVRTIAFQLASYHPSLRNRIALALKTQPDILQKTIRMQFDALVHQPLQGAFEGQEETHVISIDAIDECDLDEAVEILSILLSTIPQHPQLRVLITCRPERPFRLLLQRHRGAHVFRLHEIETSVVESDIRLYIDHCLSPEQVGEALPELLPPLWCASAKDKEALVQMAGKLFIVASTAVKFILDPRQLDPENQIRHLLDTSIGAGLASGPMDRLYTQVLRAAVPNPVGDWLDHYQIVVGAIVVAADVLSVQSLGSLLNINPNRILRTLSHLHSLIAPTKESEAFRVHHKSFPDFATSRSRCSIDSRFFIDVSARHFHLARHCLRLMVGTLKHNICEVPYSDWDKELTQLPPGTTDRIPPELAYACAHWVSHFQQGVAYVAEDHGIVDELKTFVDQHILSWLEVLVWTSLFDTAWSTVNLLSETITQIMLATEGPSSDTLLRVISALKDCLRSISLHPDIARTYPMHLYLSVYPFTPTDSMLRRLYAPSLPQETITVLSGLSRNWDPVAVAVVDTSVDNMAFSPCGSIVGVGSSRPLRLYNAKSGALVQEVLMEMESYMPPSLITFSVDGQYVAVGSGEGVRCWDVASGELIRTFGIPEESTKPIVESSVPEFGRPPSSWYAHPPREAYLTALEFCATGTVLVAGTRDGTILVWQLECGIGPLLWATDNSQSRSAVCGCPFDAVHARCWGHSINNLVPFAGSTIVIATGSDIQLWNLSIPKLMKSVPFHVAGTHSCPISFSFGNSVLAAESSAAAISLYSTSGLGHLTTLYGHQGVITTMAFTDEPSILYSASEDMTVRIWDVTAAIQLKKIVTSHTLTNAMFSASINGVVFTGNGLLLKLNNDILTAFGPDSGASYILLSPDGSTVAIYASPMAMFSNLKDLIEAPSFAGQTSESRSWTVSFRSNGELVAIQGFQGAEISILNQAAEATTSFRVVIPALRGLYTSPDMTSMVAQGLGCNLHLYNLLSGRLEALLGPLPADEAHKCADVWYSADSSVIHVLQGSNLYSATVPLFAAEASSTASSTPTIPFSKHEGMPKDLKRVCWGGLFLTSQLLPKFVWEFLQEDMIWVQTPIPASLPSRVYALAYSPDRSLVVLAVTQGEEPPYGEGEDIRTMAIQLRGLPRYELIATLADEHWKPGKGFKLQFLPSSLPYIVVGSSEFSFTSWNMSTLEKIGSYSFSPSGPIFLLHLHPYRASDFICLVYNGARRLYGLMAIQLRGAQVSAKIFHFCWFPPRLVVKGFRWFDVNPCHPNIVAFASSGGVVQIDLSKVVLPFPL